MQPEILHLHTYFLFPFSVDKQAVVEAHPEAWAGRQHWMDGLDHWVAMRHEHDQFALARTLGSWRHAAYTRFDMDSPAYQDMVFFHPFVRRVFFDTTETRGEHTEKEALIRCYTIPIDGGKKLWFRGQDRKDRSAELEVTDLRLFMFANGIGILSIGVEAFHVPTPQALWVNEALRKVYPSSGRQVREGRIPNVLTLTLEHEGQRETLAEEQFTVGEMIGFLPPLAKTITSLLYFADYQEQEFEPVLDERMIVYTYAALDPALATQDYLQSEEYQTFLSRLLYVDLDGPGYRYQPDFVRTQMENQIYRRWAHQGTYYGFTSYSNITATVGQRDCDEHQLREGFLIHRMFNTRYYLMTMVVLFYRATLLDFAERTALVSKRIFLDHEDGKLTPENMRLANSLRAEFLHFANYWYFDELANKDEEIEHFTLACREFRVGPMKREIEEEIEKLDASLYTYSQSRNTEAVNRLAMLGLIMGAGAVLTGFFGMNFGREFERYFFNGEGEFLGVHYAAVAVVVFFAFTALIFGFYLVAANWADYKDTLLPRRTKIGQLNKEGSLKRS